MTAARRFVPGDMVTISSGACVWPLDDSGFFGAWMMSDGSTLLVVAATPNRYVVLTSDNRLLTVVSTLFHAEQVAR